jgi:hypothetical protein
MHNSPNFGMSTNNFNFTASNLIIPTPVSNDDIVNRATYAEIEKRDNSSMMTTPLLDSNRSTRLG